MSNNHQPSRKFGKAIKTSGSAGCTAAISSGGGAPASIPEPKGDSGVWPTPGAFEAQRRKSGDDVLEDYRARRVRENAERFFRVVIESQDGYSELEAIVYFATRGKKLTKESCCIRRVWSKDACASEGRTRFWVPTDRQESSMDASMARCAEWCRLSSFDAWWYDIATDSRENLLLGGADSPSILVRYLATISRSPYAIDRMSIFLPLAMDAVELACAGQPYPWVTRWYSSTPAEKAMVDLGYVGALLFSIHRLRQKGEPGYRLVRPAVQCLLAHQRQDGSWSMTSTHNQGSVYATAMAVTALALHRPRGYKTIINKAVQWLCDQQKPSGMWADDGAYEDVTFLSVLVLDAIACAEGDPRVTFLGPPPVPASKRAATGRQHRE